MKLASNCLLFTLFLLLGAVSSVWAFGAGSPSVSPNKGEQADVMSKMVLPLRLQGSGQVQEIPLFSKKYASTPVAMVNGKPITLAMFVEELAIMHQNTDASDVKANKDFSEVLDRLIAIKLVDQEALNIGFDQTPAFQKKVENFALKTLIKDLFQSQLKNVDLVPEEVDELYKNMAIEVKLATYSFHNKADAEALLEASQEGGDFKSLAEKQVEMGHASGGQDETYVKLTDLLPSVAQAAYNMKEGDVSEIFHGQDSFTVFKLLDKRVYEDTAVREKAASINFRQKVLEAQKKYIQSLQDKYVQINKDGEEALDFHKIAAAKPQPTGAEIFARLKADQQPYATITVGDQTVTVSVADIAKKMEAKMYHGIQQKIDPADLEKRKNGIISDELVGITGKLEAERLKLDKTPDYLEEIQRYKDRLLFDTFMQKAVLPGIKVPEEDAKAYYFNHLEDYASPLMLKMKSLVFTNRESAEDALKKLRDKSDFNWVSSNAVNLADPDQKKVLLLNNTLLAATALPADLQKKLDHVQPGDLVFYAGPDDLYYTLLVEETHPPVARPYEAVRQEVGKVVYAQKIKEALDAWVKKLKQAYKTENYLVED